jgi:hypothetical protein
MDRSQPKDVSRKGERQLRSGVNWHGALKQVLGVY